MELSELKTSKVVLTGTDNVERMRRSLNSAYSEVPSDLTEVFSAALDQVADQQVKVAEALTRLIDTGELSEAEQNIAAATTEAQRTALRAARAYADYQADETKAIYDELMHIPANTTDLVAKKRRLDEDFAQAIRLHEKDDIAALELLLAVCSGYKSWGSDARLLIVGSEGIVESDKRRARIQYLGIAVALLLGVINIILNIINLLRK